MTRRSQSSILHDFPKVLKHSRSINTEGEACKQSSVLRPLRRNRPPLFILETVEEHFCITANQAVQAVNEITTCRDLSSKSDCSILLKC